ncbi:MAG: response regulator [Candidatus Thiodiazotropha sp. (ex Epidulcina cf. delphinae)]|nr:response regulator [Candidatus Thiodiazotropha sp. (ex Epidulcina cf. delphinae)]
MESTIGKGPLFRVELPAALAEAAVAMGVEVARPAVLGLEPGQPTWRILVVEDNPENRLLLTSLLQQAGFEIREAENGEQAVALFQQWQPHFIWMDGITQTRITLPRNNAERNRQ